MVRRAGRIGVALATLMALSVAALPIIDQATFVTTTDARVWPHMVTVSAEAAGQLVDVLSVAGVRVKQGEMLARRHDRRARRVLARAGWQRRWRTAGRPTPPPGQPRRCPCRREMRHATGLLASAVPAATFVSQTV